MTLAVGRLLAYEHWQSTQEQSLDAAAPQWVLARTVSSESLVNDVASDIEDTGAYQHWAFLDPDAHLRASSLKFDIMRVYLMERLHAHHHLFVSSLNRASTQMNWRMQCCGQSRTTATPLFLAPEPTNSRTQRQNTNAT